MGTSLRVCGRHAAPTPYSYPGPLGSADFPAWTLPGDQEVLSPVATERAAGSVALWSFGICFESVTAGGKYEGSPSLVFYRIKGIDRRSGRSYPPDRRGGKYEKDADG